ncbi:NAD(P)-binding protein [Aspergillus lucknowensis]|uniref:NAD(P)-binding protein n=1 Tax=Aspergillus lucknowensis TaxID=176173 RepID=A0ABR4LTA3_9EURO
MSSKYADAHKSTNGPGDARPTALQIIEDQGLTGQLTGKVILITGCSSGIGIETAKALATTGATLYLTARDIPAAEKALAEILKPGQVELIELDLSTLTGVREGAERFLQKSSQLNVLICNAGVMAITDLTRTPDGFETQFAVNHLAHFLLFELLKDTLLVSSSPDFQSRVVAVASSGHRGGGIRVDDYNYTKRPDEYNRWGAYSQSKTANIYFANEIERRWGYQGLHALSLTPGAISTGIQRHLPREESEEYARSTWKTMKSQAQGAATTVLAAIGKEFEGKGAVYLENAEQTGPYPEDDREYDHVPDIPGYAPHAFNEELEGRLWADSTKMAGGSVL